MISKTFNGSLLHKRPDFLTIRFRGHEKKTLFRHSFSENSCRSCSIFLIGMENINVFCLRCPKAIFHDPCSILSGRKELPSGQQVLCGGARVTRVELNSHAPDFTLPDSNDHPFQLSLFRSIKNMVLIFNRGFF